ncbi:MAG: hypothetical protein NTY47_01475, partial [Candidatus Omnitrophica bacterium]|nr:hypothetical protein [Candidatus Omnitrophota bacterium]
AFDRNYNFMTGVRDFGIGFVPGSILGYSPLGKWLQEGRQLKQVGKALLVGGGLNVISGNITSYVNNGKPLTFSQNIFNFGIGGLGSASLGPMRSEWLSSIGNTLKGYTSSPLQVWKGSVAGAKDFAKIMPLWATASVPLTYGFRRLILGKQENPDASWQFAWNKFDPKGLGFWRALAMHSLSGAESGLYLGHAFNVFGLPDTALVGKVPFEKMNGLERFIRAVATKHSTTGIAKSIKDPSQQISLFEDENMASMVSRGLKEGKSISYRGRISKVTNGFQINRITDGLISPHGKPSPAAPELVRNLLNNIDHLSFLAPYVALNETASEALFLNMLEYKGDGSKQDEIKQVKARGWAQQVGFLSLVLLPKPTSSLEEAFTNEKIFDHIRNNFRMEIEETSKVDLKVNKDGVEILDFHDVPRVGTFTNRYTKETFNVEFNGMLKLIAEPLSNGAGQAWSSAKQSPSGYDPSIKLLGGLNAKQVKENPELAKKEIETVSRLEKQSEANKANTPYIGKIPEAAKFKVGDKVIIRNSEGDFPDIKIADIMGKGADGQTYYRVEGLNARDSKTGIPENWIFIEQNPLTNKYFIESQNKVDSLRKDLSPDIGEKVIPASSEAFRIAADIMNGNTTNLPKWVKPLAGTIKAGIAEAKRFGESDEKVIARLAMGIEAAKAKGGRWMIGDLGFGKATAEATHTILSLQDQSVRNFAFIVADASNLRKILGVKLDVATVEKPVVDTSVNMKMDQIIEVVLKNGKKVFAVVNSDQGGLTPDIYSLRLTQDKGEIEISKLTSQEAETFCNLESLKEKSQNLIFFDALSIQSLDNRGVDLNKGIDLAIIDDARTTDAGQRVAGDVPLNSWKVKKGQQINVGSGVLKEGTVIHAEEFKAFSKNERKALEPVYDRTTRKNVREFYGKIAPELATRLVEALRFSARSEGANQGELYFIDSKTGKEILREYPVRGDIHSRQVAVNKDFIREAVSGIAREKGVKFNKEGTNELVRIGSQGLELLHVERVGTDVNASGAMMSQARDYTLQQRSLSMVNYQHNTPERAFAEAIFHKWGISMDTAIRHRLNVEQRSTHILQVADKIGTDKVTFYTGTPQY